MRNTKFIFELIIPMSAAVLIINYIFYKIDDKYEFTEKVRKLFKLSFVSEVCFYLFVCLILLFLLMFISLNLVDINGILYNFLLGLPLGIFFYVCGKNSIKIKNP